MNGFHNFPLCHRLTPADYIAVGRIFPDQLLISFSGKIFRIHKPFSFLHKMLFLLCTQISGDEVSRLFPGLYACLTPRSHRGRTKTRRVKATSSQVCPAGGGHRRLRCLILKSRKGIDAISHADGYAEPPSFSMPHILCGRGPARLTFSRLPSPAVTAPLREGS